MYVDHLHGLELFEDGTGCQAGCLGFCPLFAVFDSSVAFQVHGPILPQKTGPSTGKVCPTACFEPRTPENIGEFVRHPLNKSRFQGRIAKDGLG